MRERARVGIIVKSIHEFEIKYIIKFKHSHISKIRSSRGVTNIAHNSIVRCFEKQQVRLVDRFLTYSSILQVGIKNCIVYW